MGILDKIKKLKAIIRPAERELFDGIEMISDEDAEFWPPEDEEGMLIYEFDDDLRKNYPDFTAAIKSGHLAFDKERDPIYLYETEKGLAARKNRQPRNKASASGKKE